MLLSGRWAATIPTTGEPSGIQLAQRSRVVVGAELVRIDSVVDARDLMRRKPQVVAHVAELAAPDTEVSGGGRPPQEPVQRLAHAAAWCRGTNVVHPDDHRRDTGDYPRDTAERFRILSAHDDDVRPELAEPSN
jgi:hypothetical protein